MVNPPSSPPSEMESSREVQVPAQNGESSVQEMVAKYSKTRILHPMVSRICETPQNVDMLRRCLQHDLSLIRGRSSRLNDHEISISQKAYMLLMQDRKDRLGGIEIYVQEIIGLNHVNATESYACLQTAMKTRELFLHHSSPSVDNQTHEDQVHVQAITQSRPPSSIDSDLAMCNYPNSTTTTQNVHGDLFLSPVSDSLELTTQDQDTGLLAQQHPSSSGTTSDLSDPKLQRLWSLFLEARTDFNLERTDNFRRTTAAKFLRDTIENCLSYISSYPSSASNYPDEATDRQTLLKDTLILAIEVAERGSGGRKRRFEIQAKKKTSTTLGVSGKSFNRRGGRGNGPRARAWKWGKEAGSASRC